MKKRLLSILMALMLVIPTFSYASNDIINVEVIRNKYNPTTKEYDYRIEYSGENIPKGHKFQLQLPFESIIETTDDREIDLIEVKHLGNALYEITVLEEQESLKGYITGKKVVYSEEELNPIAIDGKVILDDYEIVEGEVGDTETPTEPSESIYKGGRPNGNRIDWFIYLNANREGLQATKIYDDIGNGHKLITDSIYAYEVGDNKTDKVKFSEITEDGFNIEVDNLKEEAIVISYQTEITDPSQVEFTNQLMVEGKQKASETVVIEHDSGIEGVEPDNPEPEEPETEEPTPPTPPTLPQVGESIFKVEYLMAVVLLALAIRLRKGVK